MCFQSWQMKLPNKQTPRNSWSTFYLNILSRFLYLHLVIQLSAWANGFLTVTFAYYLYAILLAYSKAYTFPTITYIPFTKVSFFNTKKKNIKRYIKKKKKIRKPSLRAIPANFMLGYRGEK